MFSITLMMYNLRRWTSNTEKSKKIVGIENMEKVK